MEPTRKLGESVESPRVDGRTARRDRNSDAVLDAVHELFVEGQLAPTVEDVALRAGVSPRSIYRYFPDSAELLRAAMRRRIQVAEPFFQLADVGQGSLEERIERLVDHRVALFDQAAPTFRAALALAPAAPMIEKQVERRRRQLTDQARAHFAAELDALPATYAEAVLDCVDLLCQFESLELLRVHRGLSLAEIRSTLVTGITALLTASPVPSPAARTPLHGAEVLSS